MIRTHNISPKTPAPQYQRIDKKNGKGKLVVDYNRDSELRPIKRIGPAIEIR